MFFLKRNDFPNTNPNTIPNTMFVATSFYYVNQYIQVLFGRHPNTNPNTIPNTKCFKENKRKKATFRIYQKWISEH